MGWPSARPLGVVARRCGGRPCLRQRVGVLGQCLVSGAGVQHQRVPVHATAVRCPVRTSERPDVRRPVSSVGVGVRGFPRPLCPAGRWWRVAVGQAAAWLGWPGSAGRPPCPRPVRRLPGSETWRSRLAQAVLGQRRRRLGLGRREEVVGHGSGRPRGRPGLGWIGAGIARWWRAGVRSEVATTLRGHRVRPRGRVAWSLRASWAGLRLARAAVVRPQHAVSAARSTLATL